MKFFDNVDRTMMLGMRMMYGGSVTRAEFNDMMNERRAHSEHCLHLPVIHPADKPPVRRIKTRKKGML